jgi:hypothetical protein
MGQRDFTQTPRIKKGEPLPTRYAVTACSIAVSPILVHPQPLEIRQIQSVERLWGGRIVIVRNHDVDRLLPLGVFSSENEDLPLPGPPVSR